MKKRAFLVTIHRADNYGTALQAYATQMFWSKLGFDLKIINYKCMEIEKEFGLAALVHRCNIKDYIKKNVRNILLIKSHMKFVSFYRKKYNLISMNNIEENEDNVYVVGSDQVWNYQITGADKTYLLDFVPKAQRKISFASSFGMREGDIDRDYLNNCNRYLNEFYKISVRELGSVGIVRKIVDKPCTVIIDPTLLLSGEEWSRIAKCTIEGPYILVYQIGHSDNIANVAKMLNEKTGLKIVSIKGSMNPNKKMQAKYVWGAGPLEFLGLFKNAEYVLTNSFHGTAFSINFHKKFFSEKLGTSSSGDTRIADLLELTGLNDRKIINGQLMVDIKEKIDFDLVEEKLVECRDYAKQYIFEAMR